MWRKAQGRLGRAEIHGATPEFLVEPVHGLGQRCLGRSIEEIRLMPIGSDRFC
jgi:hypothetical protein